MDELTGFRAWSRQAVHEIGELLVEAGRAPFDDPAELLAEPSLLGLGPLDELLAGEEPARPGQPDPWLTSHVMAYLAEYLIAKFEGAWIVDDDRASPTFGRHLVSVVAPDSGVHVPVDPLEEAVRFLGQPKGRSLLLHVIDVETRIVTAE